MVKSLLRPLFKSRASGMMPNLTAGSAASLLPVGGLYYDITQERFPNDVTEDITTDIEVIKEPEKDPVNNNIVPSGPTESTKEIATKEEELNTESLTSNDADISTYIDNDSLDRIGNYKNIIKQFLGESSGGGNLQQTALLLQLGSALMSGRTDQQGLRGFFDVVGQAGAQTAPMLFEMGIQKQKADREISSAALDLYFSELDKQGDRSGPYVNVYQMYDVDPDGGIKLDEFGKPIKLENPIRKLTVKRTSPEENKYYNLNQDLGFNMYEFIEPGEGTDAFGLAFSDEYLSVGKEDSAAQADQLKYANFKRI